MKIKSNPAHSQIPEMVTSEIVIPENWIMDKIKIQQTLTQLNSTQLRKAITIGNLMMMMMIRWDVKKEINIKNNKKKTLISIKTDISIEQLRTFYEFQLLNLKHFIIFLILFLASCCFFFGKDTMKNSSYQKSKIY